VRHFAASYPTDRIGHALPIVPCTFGDEWVKRFENLLFTKSCDKASQITLNFRSHWRTKFWRDACLPRAALSFRRSYDARRAGATAGNLDASHGNPITLLSALTAFLRPGRLERLGRALRISLPRYHCAPPLHPRSNAASWIVATSDTSEDPTQPNRLEKNANTAHQLTTVPA
jgi:hypothetical protein